MSNTQTFSATFVLLVTIIAAIIAYCRHDKRSSADIPRTYHTDRIEDADYNTHPPNTGGHKTSCKETTASFHARPNHPTDQVNHTLIPTTSDNGDTPAERAIRTMTRALDESMHSGNKGIRKALRIPIRTDFLGDIVAQEDHAVPHLAHILTDWPAQRHSIETLYHSVHALRRIATPKAQEALAQYLISLPEPSPNEPLDLISEAAAPAILALSELDYMSEPTFRRCLRMNCYPVAVNACEALLIAGHDDAEVISRLVELTSPSATACCRESAYTRRRAEKILEIVASSQPLPRIGSWQTWYQELGPRYVGRGWKLPKDSRNYWQ